MTDKEILEKIFIKAYYNNQPPPHKYKHPVYDRLEFYGKKWLDTQLILAEILSHNFAKAFWGKFKQPVIESVICVTNIKTGKIILELPWGEFQETKPYSEDEKLLGAIFMCGNYKDINNDYNSKRYVCTDQGSIGWEKGLQQMVLEKEPLKYLEKFL